MDAELTELLRGVLQIATPERSVVRRQVSRMARAALKELEEDL